MEYSLKNSKLNVFLETVKQVFDCKFFPFVTAFWVLACYYLGWDVACIYYVCLTGAAMFLLLDDLTPLLPHILFMNVITSAQNSPLDIWSSAGSDYYVRIENLIQIALMVVVLITALFIRLARSAKREKFKPNTIFWGLCALSATFVLNGIGSEYFGYKNPVFGAVLSFAFLAIYVIVYMNCKLTQENFIKICLGFVAFSGLIMTELIIKYIADYDRIIHNGHIIKDLIVLGWGVWNYVGTFLAISIPPVCLLAAKSKYGYLFYLYAALLVIGPLFTGSRQAMMGSVFAFGISSIALMVKSRTRIANAVIFGFIVLSVVIVISIFRQEVLEIFKKLIKDLFNENWELNLNNHRLKLWTSALNFFKEYPVLGGGFYLEFELFDIVGIGEFIPKFAHNTFAEILGTCGILGMAAYLAHRVTTVIEFFKKPSLNKFFIAASILTLLLICLVDNYIFYILPTLIYSSMLHFATGKEKTEQTK